MPNDGHPKKTHGGKESDDSARDVSGIVGADAHLSVNAVNQAANFDAAATQATQTDDLSADTKSTAGIRDDADFVHDTEDTGDGALVWPSIRGFQILRRIGGGGMGDVFLAEQHAPRRLVAIKTIRLDRQDHERARLRFLAEAEAAGRLNHDRIVPVYQSGQDGDQLFLVMAYVDGGDLSALVSAGNQSPKQIASIVHQITEGVAHAHQHGVIHRDLKPANILLDRNGAAKLTDFGLAKLDDSPHELTKTGQFLGTPSYASPEQAVGDAERLGPATDLYSIGAILYGLLCGRPPFRGDSTAATIRQVVEEEPIAPRTLSPAIPRDLETICLRCLEKEPNQRYASAQQLADELARFLEDRPIHAKPPGVLGRSIRWYRRNRTVGNSLASIAFILTVATLVSGFYASVASRRSIELSVQNKALKRSISRAEAAEDDAKKMLGIAKSNSQYAVKTLTNVVSGLDRDLRDTPGTSAARRRILDKVMQEFDQLSTELLSSGQVNKNLVLAHLAIADVNRRSGTREGKSGAVTAGANFDKAIQIAREVRKTFPDTIDSEKLLATALEEAALFYLKDSQLEIAQPLMDEVLERRERILASEPDDAMAQFRLAANLNDSIYLAFNQGRNDDAIALLDRMETLCKMLADRPQQPIEVRNLLLAFHHQQASRFESEGKFDRCVEQLETAVQVAIATDRDFPESSRSKVNVAEMYRSLGNHWITRDNPKEAEPAIRASLELYETIAEQRPDRRDLKALLYETRVQMANIFKQTGRPREALQVLDETLVPYEALALEEMQNIWTFGSFIEGLLIQGKLHAELDDPSAAQTTFEKLIRLCESNEEIKQEFAPEIREAKNRIEKLATETSSKTLGAERLTETGEVK
ncbi:MAG: protein kinase [Planctomycetota bacterium]